MRQYALRRLIYLPIIAAAVSIITFFTLRLPFATDPATYYINQNTTQEQEDAIRRDLGIDRPVMEQFVAWLGDMATADFGSTFRSKQPVWNEVKRRLPVTFEILVLSVLFGALISIPLGIVSAMRQNTISDYAVRFMAVFGQSIPDFFLLVLLIVLPSLWWNYSPPIGGHVSLFRDPLENLRLYVPPTLLLAAGGASGMMRLTRSTLLEVFRQDYVRTARAKGLPERAVVLSHGLRNALVPIVTLLGAQITVLLFGALILEQIFSLNGLGQFLYISAVTADYPVVQFLVLYTALIVIVLNLLVDLSYALIDPRVKYN